MSLIIGRNSTQPPQQVYLGDQPIVEMRLGSNLIWTKYVAFLGNDPVIEIRLGDQLIWPAQVVEPEPTPEIIELPILQINPIRDIKLPSLSKKDTDLLDKIAKVGAISTLALPVLSTGIQITCESGNFLPTRAEIVKEFNKILQIPSQLKVYLQQIQTDVTDRITNAEDEIRKTQAEIEGGDLTTEQIQEKTLDVIGEIDPALRDQIEGIISQVETIIELISEILAPYWKKGEVRNWQKESDDAWSELIADYHIYIPTKILEMISKLVPINFDINIYGIEINLLKILETEEQERVQKQIEDEVDRFYAMLPPEYQQYNGDFGLICKEYKSRITWQYVKSKIIEICTGQLHAAFSALIEKFQDVWDLLGLPSIPDPLNFNVEEWIKLQIDTVKLNAENFKKDALAELETLETQIEEFDIEKEIEKEKKNLERTIKEFDIEAEAYAMIIDQLEGIELFGISLLEVIGGDLEETVKMPEKDIDNLIKGARDWSKQWQKELVNLWIKKITTFLEAIGLGKLMDLLTLTFCDVLELIGIPTSFDIPLPEPELTV